jgi:hypothetical protein
LILFGNMPMSADVAMRISMMIIVVAATTSIIMIIIKIMKAAVAVATSIVPMSVTAAIPKIMAAMGNTD